MRSSVIVTSVNASSRNIHTDGGELKFSRSITTTTYGTRPVKGSLKVGRTQDYDEFTRPTRSELVNRQNLAGQIPFPCPPSPQGLTPENASLSTDSGDGVPPGCPTNTANDVVDVVPKKGVFLRSFTVLKRVGAKLVMPPYTIDGGLNRIARKNGYINFNATATNLPLM